MQLNRRIMRALHAVLAFALVFLTSANAADPPRKSNGLTEVVQWDNYTLFLYDQRMFL